MNLVQGNQLTRLLSRQYFVRLRDKLYKKPKCAVFENYFRRLRLRLRSVHEVLEM